MSEPTFHAYVRRDELPPVSEIVRAMSSRGWRVSISGVETLAEASDGALPVQIDDQDTAITFKRLEDGKGEFDALRSELPQHFDQETYKEVLRQMELRLSFTGDAVWAREMARSVALLSAGAFENPQDNKLLFYGR